MLENAADSQQFAVRQPIQVKQSQSQDLRHAYTRRTA